MTNTEFSKIISDSKAIVLGAIRKNLAPRFYASIDDVVQETYLRAYNALEKNKFRGDSLISTWLYTIARNESLRMNKKLHREEEKFLKLKKKQSEKRYNTRPKEEENNIQNINPDILHDLIITLPEKYKLVLQLSLNGFNEKKIAGELQISKGTVKSRKFRAKEILYKLIKEGKYEQ